MATLLETVRRLEGDAPNTLLTLALAAQGVAEAAGVTEATARRHLNDAIDRGLLVKLLEGLPPGHTVQLPRPGGTWATVHLKFSPWKVTRPVEVTADPREANGAANSRRRQFVATRDRVEEVRRWVSDQHSASIQAANDEQRAKDAEEEAEVRRRDPDLMGLVDALRSQLGEYSDVSVYPGGSVHISTRPMGIEELKQVLRGGVNQA